MCAVDLMYLRGILKKVATGRSGGGGDAGKIGGSTRLANILDSWIIRLMTANSLGVFFEERIHCTGNRTGGRNYCN